MTQCSFGVQSVVCATLSGVPSTPLDVTLKGTMLTFTYTLDHIANFIMLDQFQSHQQFLALWRGTVSKERG
jgi:hypothetical protein